MDLDNIQRKYGLPAPLPVVQNGKFAPRFPLNLEHRGDDVFQFGGKYIGEIENIYDLLYKILTNQEIDASLSLPYAIKITEDKFYIRDKTNSEWITMFDITKPNFPKEIELYELIYKAITHQVIGEDTSYPGQFKIEENILYVRDKDNLTWTQIGDVTKEFLGATEATQAILDQVNEILTEVQELKTELNRQIATTNETLTTALQAANEAMTSAQSINIRTFNSVEEMKASNTLKAGALAKTLGFYTAGDGGGADYVVKDTANNYTPDEASIIMLKNNLFAHLIIQDVLNVKQMGAYGDGAHDDTNVLKNKIFLSGNHDLDYLTIYFPDGNYLISETLETSSEFTSNVKMEQNARIFTETEDLEYLIRLGRWGTARWDGWFIGGILDCNNKGKSCFGASSFGKDVGFVIRDVVCKNFKLYGFHTNPNNIPSAGFKAYNINFLNNKPWIGSICIYNANTDNFFKDLYAVNVQGGIETDDKITVDNFHTWIDSSCIAELWENSFLAKIKADNGANNAKFSKCYADTVRYGWIGVYVGDGIVPRLTTVDCEYEVNGNVAGVELQTKYPPCVFDLQDYSTIRDFGSGFIISTNVPGARIINSSNNKYDLQGCNFYGTTYSAPITELANLITAPVNSKITSGAVPRNLKSGRYHVKAGVTDVPEAGKEYILEVIACGSIANTYSNNIYSVQRFTVLDMSAPNVYQRIVTGTLDNANNVSNWVKLNS